MQSIIIVFPVKHQFIQNDLVDMTAKVIKHYLSTTKAMQSALPKQSIQTQKNRNNGHMVNRLKSQSFTKHCVDETEIQPSKRPSLQWSITSTESQQVLNCDEHTVKVIIFLIDLILQTNRSANYINSHALRFGIFCPDLNLKYSHILICYSCLLCLVHKKSVLKIEYLANVLKSPKIIK